VPWFSSKPQIDCILPSKHGRTQQIGGETDCSFMLYLKIEHVFENYMRGNCPVDLPLLAGFTRKICQHHLETRAANV